MPSGSLSSRVNPGSFEYSVRRLSLGEMINSMACWRRSARFTAALRKLASEWWARARRTLSRPADTAGKVMPTISPTITTTIIISTRVMPRAPAPRPLFLLALPTENVGIQPFAARLAVGSEADDIRLVSVIDRVLVHVVVRPRIFRDVLGHVGPRPLVLIPRPDAQGLQALLGSGERAGIQFVGAQRGHEVVDLGARRGDSGRVAVLQNGGSDQRGKQRDDGHHHEHFDQGDARLTASPVSSFLLEHGYTATSLMLVIASSMLRIRAPTITPITRITSGSKIAVKRLMEARVSVSYISAIRANIWSSRPVSSPTISRCAASGGKTPDLRTGAAIPSPRLTPCATPSSAPEIILLFRVAAAMAMDCTSGTVLATRVAMARANRAVSAFRSVAPSMGILSRAPSHQRRPATVRVYVVQKMMNATRAAAPIHQQA